MDMEVYCVVPFTENFLDFR